MVEIGVPFTDPMADGVTIQRSSLAALEQGVTLHWITRDAARPAEGRRRSWCSWATSIRMLAYGLPEAGRAMRPQVGVSGFIVPDLPIEESAAFEQALAPQGLALIRMVTPVTPQARLEQLCSSAQGFVYAVTMTGTTGRSVGTRRRAARKCWTTSTRCASSSTVPVCAGFGIRESAQVAALAPHVDGVIVGSAMIEAMEKGASPAALLRKLRG